MRKLLTVLAAIGVLSTMFVGAAVAADNDWVVLMRAGSGGPWSSPFNSGHNSIVLGTQPTTTDGLDLGKDGMAAVGPTPPPGADTGVKAAWYRPEWAAQTDPFSRFDYKAPLAPGQIKVWNDLLVWAGLDYSAPSIILNFFTTTSKTAPLSIQGVPVAYRVDLVYAPDGYSGPTSWLFTSFGETSGSNIFLGQLEVPVLPGVKIASPISGTGPLAATQVGGYRFNVVVPEPGSMLVLASGITGLMGLIARRRSA